MGKFEGFSSVQLVKPKRSTFDLSNLERTTTRMGRLTPINILECAPGDSFSGNAELLVRLAPLLAPIYDNIQAFIHHFFVPNRLLWDEWEEFITAGRLGPDPEEPTPIPPFIDIDEVGIPSGLFDTSSLADYLGVPPITGALAALDWTGKKLDLMPFAAYQLVWHEYYRDRNYIPDSTYFPLASGSNEAPISTYMLQIRTRDYLRDYFTSALPFTQRGEEVLLPLAGTGSVTYMDTSDIKRGDGGNLSGGASQTIRYTGGTSSSVITDSGTFGARIENIDEVLLENSEVSINDFRAAYALQVWLERNAIAGSRYTESIMAHFGVRSQDSRLQRPEYIGGGRVPIKISEVVSTAYSNDGEATVPLANMAGHGISYGNQNGYRYFCPEHGFIISIMSIMVPPSYHQGLPRMFYARRTFLGYFWPTFAKLGEQQVDKVELFMNPTNMTEVNGELPLFGYQSRYADWKWKFNTNKGDFHDELLFWTLTRQFATTPELNATFVNFDDTTQNRIFAVNGTADNCWCYVSNRVTVKRALPYFGQPNTLGFV